MFKLTDRKVDFLLLVVLSTVIIFSYSYNKLSPLPYSASDLGVPYLFGPPLYYLSEHYPFYSLFAVGLFKIDPDYFGYSLNFFNSFFSLIVPISMYTLLEKLQFKRFPKLIGSLIYLFNPINYVRIGDYTNWSAFLAFIPLVVYFMIKYKESLNFKYLITSIIIMEFSLEFNYIMGGIQSIRLYLPILIPIVIYVFFSVDSKLKKFKVLIHYTIALFLFLLLNIILIANITSQTVPFSGTNGFISFHLGNLLYTYSNQNILYSIAGVTMYNNNGIYPPANYLNTFTLIAIIIWASIILLSFAVVIKKKFKGRNFYITLIFISVTLIASEISIHYGLLVPLFTRFPALFVYEYPFYFNVIMSFPYAILLANLIREFVTYRTKPGEEHGGLNNISALRKPSLNNKEKITHYATGITRIMPKIAVIIIVIIIMTPEISYTVNQNSNYNSSINYRSNFFNDIGKFFLGKSGDYGILFLPLNLSTYSLAESCVPEKNLFFVPYASSNEAPYLHSNITDVENLLSIFASNNTVHLNNVLTNDNIEYIVVLNPKSYANVEVNGVYIDGGGQNFLKILKNDNNLSYSYKTYNFVILRNNNYSLPFSIDPNIALLQPSSMQSSYDTLISSNGNFSNKSLSNQSWMGYSTNHLGNNSSISFVPNGVNLSVFGEAGKYNETIIWQRVNLFGPELLVIKTSTSNSSNVTARAFAIFHNSSDNNSFYTKDQYYFNVYPNKGVDFTLNSPTNSTFVYFGIVIFNYSQSFVHGYATINNLNLYVKCSPSIFLNNTVRYLNNSYSPMIRITGQSYRNFSNSSRNVFVPLLPIPQSAKCVFLTNGGLVVYNTTLSNFTNYDNFSNASIELLITNLNGSAEIFHNGTLIKDVTNQPSSSVPTFNKSIVFFSGDSLTINGTVTIEAMFSFFHFNKALSKYTMLDKNNSFTINTLNPGTVIIRSSLFFHIISTENCTLDSFSLQGYQYIILHSESTSTVKFSFLSANQVNLPMTIYNVSIVPILTGILILFNSETVYYGLSRKLEIKRLYEKFKRFFN